jgi:hypothetical protein
MTAPCKGCPDRYPGCHDHCPRYAEYKAEREAIREQRNLEFATQGILLQRQTGIQRQWLLKRKREGR